MGTPAGRSTDSACRLPSSLYAVGMHSHSGIRRKWRRFTRKFGSAGLVGFLVVLTLVFVGFMMYLLTSMDYRWRW